MNGMEMELQTMACEPKQLRSSILDRAYWRVRRFVKRLRGDYRPENSNLYKWAKAELDRILVKCEGDEMGLDMQKAINQDILDIVKTFCSQEHSGTTAWYTLDMIKRLLNWKPITPLTGEDEEWNELTYQIDGFIKEQNKRCSSVFRNNKDNSTAYYIDARVYSDNGGGSWFHKGGDRDFITFPFSVPNEPEYIYLNGEDSDEVITDPMRIKELREEWEKQFEEVHAD